jgi:hypothetical protein
MSPAKKKVARKAITVPEVKLTTAQRRELRSKLLLLYISAVTKPMLPDLLRRAEFQGLPIKTVEDWKYEDRWEEQRKAFQASLFAQVKTRIGDRLAQTTLQMLEELAPIKDRLIARLATETFDDLSADKLLKAFCTVLELQARLTEQAVGLITPTQGTQEAPHDASIPSPVVASGITDLTVDEAREAAFAIMRRRREAAFNAAKPAGGTGPNGAPHGPG